MNGICDGTHTGVDDSILGDDAVLSRVRFNDLELDGPHSTTNEEGVALADRSIC